MDGPADETRAGGGGREPKAAAGKVTVRDVAARAGVSGCTVSLVLSGHPRVSEATRRRVLAAAAALGYQRSDAVSRALRAVRTRGRVPYRDTIACVSASERLDGPLVRGQADPPGRPRRLLREMYRGLEARAAETGVRLDYFSLADQGAHKIAGALKARGIRSVILCARVYDPNLWDGALDAFGDFSRVALGACAAWRVPCLVVGANLLAAGRRAVLAAWQRGYRRLVIKSVPLGLDPERRFEAGVRLATRQFGLNLPLEILDSEIADREAVAARYMAASADCCFVGWASDEFVEAHMARGGRRGGRPGWIDWHANVQLHAPAITGIDQRDEEQARHAVDMALSQIEGSPGAPSSGLRELLFAPGWIEGASAPAHPNRRINLAADDSYPGLPSGRWAHVSFRGLQTSPLHTGADWQRTMPLPVLDPGEWRFHGVPFRLGGGREGARILVLRSLPCPAEGGRPLPEKAVLEVGRRVRAVYFLHACAYTASGAAVGAYRFRFAGGAEETVTLVAGRRELSSLPLPFACGGRANIQDWWPFVRQIESSAARPVCLVDVERRLGDMAYLYTLEWANPRPARRLERIEVEGAPGGKAMLALLAVALSVNA